MLSPLKNLATEARQAGRGLGAFNVIHLEHAETIATAAEAAGTPVVMQISQNAIKYHGGNLKPLAKGMLSIADSSTARICVHLDHATDLDLIRHALYLGFTSIMYDGSQLPDNENRHVTRTVAGWCHDRGVTLEAELGEVGGKDGVHAPGARTNPNDGKQFIADTGVDLLAVAVGSSHAMTTRTAILDLDLIAQLAATVPAPLVLHGSSGVSDDYMVKAIRAGMTKINVATHLNKIFTDSVRHELQQNPNLVDPRKWTKPGYAAVQAEIQRLLELYAAA